MSLTKLQLGIGASVIAVFDRVADYRASIAIGIAKGKRNAAATDGTTQFRQRSSYPARRWFQDSRSAFARAGHAIRQ